MINSIETFIAVLLMDVAKFLIFYNNRNVLFNSVLVEKELSLFAHAYKGHGWDKIQSYMDWKENAGLRNNTKANYIVTRLFILK